MSIRFFNRPNVMFGRKLCIRKPETILTWHNNCSFWLAARYGTVFQFRLRAPGFEKKFRLVIVFKIKNKVEKSWSHYQR
jgi:hypothetical protein